MLVLSRKKNQKIVIGDSTVITIVEVNKGTVRLGIDAPKDVPVHRQEVYDALRKQQASDSSADPPEEKEPQSDAPQH